MLGLTILYGLCLMSGCLIERRFSADSLLERFLVVVTVAAAQLLLSVQILSLQGWLTGFGLLAANTALVGIVYAIVDREKIPETRLSSRKLVVSAWGKIKAEKKDSILIISGVVALLLIGICWAFGVALIPFGDGYHYDKPLFWRQHLSILPFAAPNPRIVATSFASEALTLPGYIFLSTDKMGAVFALPAAFLCIWLIFSISLQLGCSFTAAGSSSFLAVGYTQFAGSFTSMSTEIFLAMMWSGAGILFLLNTRSPEQPKIRLPQLSWAILCFALACGAKNTVILSTPFFMVCIVIVLRDFWIRKEVWSHAIVIGGISLLCSGVIWNYASNKIWFGNPKGPLIMQQHTSSEFDIHSMWTRVCRGSVMFLLDTTWVPASKQHEYADICADSLEKLGAKESLAEDNGYYGLARTNMVPRLGFGLLGVFIFAPGVILGLLHSLGIIHRRASRDLSIRMKTTLLVLLTVGSFVLVHVALRWPSIGHFRIMPFFLMAGAPLAALLLERSKIRIAGLLLLTITAAIFMRIDVKRHLGWEPNGTILRTIFNQGKSHQKSVEYNWSGYGVQRTSVDEGHIERGVYSIFLSGIKKRSVIGFVGNMGENANSYLYHLFGNDFSNKIVPLTDSRRPDFIQPPPYEMEYVVFHVTESGFPANIREWAYIHKYTLIFSATIEGDSKRIKKIQRGNQENL